MDKKKSYKFWCGIALAFLIIYLVYQLIFLKEKNIRMISKAIWLIIIYAAAMFGIRLKKGLSIANFKVYEDAYKNIIGESFQNDKKSYRILLKAIDNYNNKKYQTAINTLSKIEGKCESYHDTSAVLTFKALSYDEMGQKNLAVDTYEKLLQTDGSNSLAWSNLGLLYEELGKSQKAIDSYENAVRYDPYNASAYNNLSHFYLNQNKPEKALENALNAIKFNGNLYEAKGNAAVACVMLGKIDEARGYYNLYKKDNKNAPEFEEVFKGKI